MHYIGCSVMVETQATNGRNAREQYAHLDRFDQIGDLHAKKTGNAVTVGQVVDDDLQLVTLKFDDLHAIVGRQDGGADESFDLAGHPGTATRTGDVEAAVAAPDFESAVVEIEQSKFSSDHVGYITVVDAAELLAEYAN